jgi:threonine/homoserine/homoserine lactone efflux protein
LSLYPVDIFILLAFIAKVVVVTASGALAPGPLFFTNITQGSKSGAKGGLAFSVGHTIFELGLVAFLALTLQTVLNEADRASINLVVGVAGGIALLLFGFFQIRGALSSESMATEARIPSKSPLLLGTLFTGLNPYFILWWVFIGAPLILEALNLASFAGVLIMYVSHVWMDYAWLIATAYLARKGTTLIGSKRYRIVMMVFGVVLIFFGLDFLIPSLLGVPPLI